MVSNLVGYEGIDTLLAAVAELRRRGLPVRPLIVGDGPERAALERQAGQLGLTGTAIFTGRVPMTEVRRYHALLDLFVVPRTSDRVCQLVTPLKPVEAMASGLTVVASDVGALREIIRPEVTGALATSGDPGVLCRYHGAPALQFRYSAQTRDERAGMGGPGPDLGTQRGDLPGSL